MINWEDKYNTGISEIDLQHRVIVRLISTLSDILERAKAGEDVFDAANIAIFEIEEYTKWHFDFEEKLFKDKGYSMTEAHCEEHRACREAIAAIDSNELDANQEEVINKTLTMLISWLFKHILNSDMKYVTELS